MKEITRMGVFIKVVDSGNFSEAGRQLNMAPSSVSRQISAIEDALEIRLLHRSTHSISLTEAGHIYYQRVKRILEDLEDTYDSLSQLQKGPKGTLRLNVNVEFGSEFVVPHLPEFLRKYPDIKIDLMMTDRIIDLLEEEVDLAIRYGNLEDSSLVIRKFPSTNNSVICASPDYFKKWGKPKTPEDLKAHNWLNYKYKNSHILYLKEGQKTEEISVSGNMQSDSGFALREAVIAGVGIAFIPTWLIRDALNSEHLEVVMDQYTIHQGNQKEKCVYAVYLNKQYLPLKVRVFLDFLISTLDDL